MSNTINTNAASINAVKNHQSIKKTGNAIQTKISTGKEVNSAKDNAALFSIAQKMLSQQSGRSSVETSLNRAQSATDVALAASDHVNDLLTRARELTVSARDEGLDDNSRQLMNEEFQSLKEQIRTSLDVAEFDGINVLKYDGGDISAIADDDASNNINVANFSLGFGGNDFALDANADISTLAGANTAFTQLESSISSVSNAQTVLGASSNQYERLSEFNQTLQDVTEVGIGNLVDANLAKERAAQVANDIKEQLSLKTMSIANAQSQNIVSLFG